MELHIFPATFQKHGNKLGSQTLVFEVDDLNSELIKELAIYPQGKAVLIVAYEILEGEDPLKKVQGNKGEMSNNFMKKLHAQMKDYEASTGVSLDQIKRLLKLKLKARGIDKKSLADLTESELSNAIFVLNTDLNPSRFNYEEYINK